MLLLQYGRPILCYYFNMGDQFYVTTSIWATNFMLLLQYGWPILCYYFNMDDQFYVTTSIWTTNFMLLLQYGRPVFMLTYSNTQNYVSVLIKHKQNKTHKPTNKERNQSISSKDQKEITLAGRVGGLKTIKDDRYVNEHMQDHRKTHKKELHLFIYILSLTWFI